MVGRVCVSYVGALFELLSSCLVLHQRGNNLKIGSKIRNDELTANVVHFKIIFVDWLKQGDYIIVFKTSMEI